MIHTTTTDNNNPALTFESEFQGDININTNDHHHFIK